MFGTDLVDASLALSVFVAFAAGFLSFLSPCVLPVVPPYVAYMAGTSLHAQATVNQRLRSLQAAGFFVLGLSTVFLILGMAAASLGQVFLQYQRETAIGAGIVIVIFGLHFLGLLRIPFLNYDARFEAKSSGGSAVGAYVLGLAFAFGWSPCLGPVLAAVLALAAQEASLARAMLLMAFYAAGLGVPFLLVALFLSQSTAWLNRFKRHMHKIELGIGALLLLVGVTMATGAFTAFAFWLLEAFPALGKIG